MIQRRDTSGALDTSFGTNGEVHLFGDHGTDSLRYLTVDSSDRILAVGSARVEVLSGKGKKKTASYPRLFTVVRLTASGALDTGFGDGGIVHVDLPEANGGTGQAESILELSSGALIVCGQAYGVAAASSGGGKGKKGGGGGQTSTSDAIALVKLTSTGAVDTAFGDAGYVIDDATTGDDEPWSGAIGLPEHGPHRRRQRRSRHRRAMGAYGVRRRRHDR